MYRTLAAILLAAAVLVGTPGCTPVDSDPEPAQSKEVVAPSPPSVPKFRPPHQGPPNLVEVGETRDGDTIAVEITVPTTVYYERNVKATATIDDGSQYLTSAQQAAITCAVEANPDAKLIWSLRPNVSHGVVLGMTSNRAGMTDEAPTRENPTQERVVDPTSCSVEYRDAGAVQNEDVLVRPGFVTPETVPPVPTGGGSGPHPNN